jgi:hypothetical protein
MTEKNTRFEYEVICTYVVEASSKADAGRVAGSIAQGLARTGVISSTSPNGVADLLTTTARFKRVSS